MLPRLSDVERSVALQSVFAIGSTLTYLLFFWKCATPPHIQVRHCMWLSFTRPSPTLVLQATNTGVKKAWVRGDGNCTEWSYSSSMDLWGGRFWLFLNSLH